MLCLIYMHSPLGAVHPRALCLYIRQSMSACVITNMLHFRHCPNLTLTVQLVTDTDSDSGRYFNVFIMLPNVSMTYPIVLILIMGLYSQ